MSDSCGPYVNQGFFPWIYLCSNCGQSWPPWSLTPRLNCPGDGVRRTPESKDSSDSLPSTADTGPAAPEKKV